MGCLRLMTMPSKKLACLSRQGDDCLMLCGKEAHWKHLPIARALQLLPLGTHGPDRFPHLQTWHHKRAGAVPVSRSRSGAVLVVHPQAGIVSLRIQTASYLSGLCKPQMQARRVMVALTDRRW